MPPRLNSRHSFVEQRSDGNERLYLTPRKRFLFKQRSDNRTHVVGDGDTLFNLAARYFPRFPRPAGLWWIIADFQPTPIHDPTIKLSPGRVLVVPSERTVDEEILSERRRGE